MNHSFLLFYYSMRKYLLLALVLIGASLSQTSFALSGFCNFAWVFNTVYVCTTTSITPIYTSLSGTNNVQNQVSSTITFSGGVYKGVFIKTVTGTLPFTVFWDNVAQIPWPTGATWSTGPTGLTWAIWSTGAIGATWATWSTGSQGIQWLIGATGSIGPPWIQGLLWNTGATGPKWNTWSTGAIGSTGSQGIQWPTGLTWVQWLSITGAIGPQWIQWVVGATWSTGPQWIQWNTWFSGGTGSIVLDGTIGVLNLSLSGWLPVWWSSSPPVSFSWVTLNGYFDHFSFQYDLPSWNIILHLNAFGVIDSWSYPDIVVDKHFEVVNVVSINDFTDPRLIISVTYWGWNNSSTTACGWYWLGILSSLIQWFTDDILPNNTYLGFGYELVWCPGYKPTDPQTIIFSWSLGGWSGATFDGSGQYLALTKTIDGTIYLDQRSFYMLLLYAFVSLLILYTIFHISRTILFWKSR